MTTTLTITSGQTSFTAQGYTILPSPGTAVPDNLAQAILSAANTAGVVLSSSAGTGNVFVPSRRFTSTATGAPSAGQWFLGDEVIDSIGSIYECTAGGSPGTWVSAQTGAFVRLPVDPAALPSTIAISPVADHRSVLLGGLAYCEPSMWWDSVRSKLCALVTSSAPESVYYTETSSQTPLGASWAAPVKLIGHGAFSQAGDIARSSVLVDGSTVYVYYPDNPAGGNLRVASFPYGSSPVGNLTDRGIVLAPAGAYLGIVNNSVVRDANGYTLLFESNVSGGAHWQTGMATCSTPTGTFTVQQFPVSGLDFGGAFGGPDLHYTAGSYSLLYHACPTSGAASPTEIYRASSLDAVNWRRDAVPLVQRTTKDENQQVADPCYVVTPQFAGLVWSAMFNDTTPLTYGAAAAQRERSGLVLISRQVLAADAAGITFDGLPQNFEDLVIQWTGRTTDVSNSNAKAFARLNNDQTVGNYYNAYSFSFGSTTGAGEDAGSATRIFVGAMPYSANPAGMAGSGELTVLGYARTAFQKNVTWRNMDIAAASGTGAITNYQGAATWKSTAAVTRFDFLPAGSNLLAGTVVSVYGRR